MKFDDINNICIYPRKTKIEKSDHFVTTSYDYSFLEKNDIDKIYKFDKMIDSILSGNLRYCLLVEDFSDQAIDRIADRLKVINRKAYDHFKYNMDLRLFTKNLDVHVNQNSSLEAYYFLADNIYDFYENRNKFTNLKNCLIFIDSKEKFKNIVNNQQVLISYFKDSNVEELNLILTTKDDISLLNSFNEVGKNKYVYEEDGRKIIIRMYENIFLFDEVSDGV